MKNAVLKNFVEAAPGDFLHGGAFLFLGEGYSYLRSKGVNVPEGFVLNGDAFHWLISDNRHRQELEALLSNLDREEYTNLTETARALRASISNLSMPVHLQETIAHACSSMTYPVTAGLRFSVRCSSKADDGSNNRLNGLWLNVSDYDELYKACNRCFACRFTDEYLKNSADPLTLQPDSMHVYVSVMVRADLACSGYIYSKDPEDGQNIYKRIEGCWGMAENIQRRLTEPDVFYIQPPSHVPEGQRPAISKIKGSKAKTLIYYNVPEESQDATFVNIDTPERKREKYVLSDKEVTDLANYMQQVEEYYHVPVRVKWAKDGLTNQLFILEAAPVGIRM